MLLDPHSGQYLYFSVVLEDVLIQRMVASSSNPIATIEMLGVACALSIWHDALADRAAIIFVDNEATKCCLIKGYSPQVDMAAVCELCTRSEIEQKSILYFERVASPSNIGDGPSRFALPPPLPSWGTAQRSRLGVETATAHRAPTARDLDAREFWRQFPRGVRDATCASAPDVGYVSPMLYKKWT